ncbi:hypothetical protein ES703_80336 [subsurface metagenome]
MEGHERQQHGEGNGQTHQHSVAHTHDKKENHNNQNQAGKDVVFQVGDHDPDVFGMVHQLAHLGPRGPGGHLLLDEFVDLLNDAQHILASTLLNLDVDRLAAIQTSAALLVFEPVDYPGYVFKVNRAALVQSDHKAVDFFGVLELARNAELEAAVAHADSPAGDILVFLGDNAL